MFRGILKTRSKDINNFQRIIDPLFISAAFCKIFNNNIYIDLKFFLIFFFSLSILSANKLYDSYRIKNLINLIPNIFTLSVLITIIAPLIQFHNYYFTSFQLIIFFSLCFLFLFFHHFILRLFLRYLRSKGLNTRNAVFFGSKDSFLKVQNELEKYPWIGFNIIYWFSPNKNDYEGQGSKSLDIVCRGNINKLIETIKAENLDNLFFCHGEGDQISLSNVLKKLGDICVPVTYLIDWNINSISFKKEFFGDMVGLNIWNPGSSLINEKIKRVFDFLLGILLLFILLPVLIIISLLIKISSKGPVIFLQERYGLNGVSFKMLKFRTMYISENETSEKIVQAKKNDLRITKIGKFLRKYSLDELPQLINVIKGEMSLVGPRPHAAEQNEYYRSLILGYMQRHSRLPGMTGLAQINGARGQTSDINLMKLRIKYDLEYNDNWNLLKDFSILLKTFICVLKGSAY